MCASRTNDPFHRQISDAPPLPFNTVMTRESRFLWKNIAKSSGGLFFGLGLVPLVLIICAMVSRPAHCTQSPGW